MVRLDGVAPAAVCERPAIRCPPATRHLPQAREPKPDERLGDMTLDKSDADAIWSARGPQYMPR